MHSCWNLWGTQKLWSVPNCYFIWVSNHWFRGKSAMRQPFFIVCSHSSLQALHDTSWTSLNWLEVLCHPKTHSFIVKFCKRQCVWNIHFVFFPSVVFFFQKKKISVTKSSWLTHPLFLERMSLYLKQNAPKLWFVVDFGCFWTCCFQLNSF